MPRTCITCGVSIDNRRPEARACSDSCRRRALRRGDDALAARDSTAAALLLQQSDAVADLRVATTPAAADAAWAELGVVDALVRRLFGH